eukprot:g12302.t1
MDRGPDFDAFEPQESFPEDSWGAQNPKKALRWKQMQYNYEFLLRRESEAEEAGKAFCCEYCGRTVELFGWRELSGKRTPKHAATADHVQPVARGGRYRWDNLKVCCHDCNQKKGHQTPEAWKRQLLARGEGSG